MSIAIVTDSNSGITQKEAKELGITVIPMPFLINGEEFFEDINLTQDEFYEKLLNDADVSTSQPNIYSIVEIWKDLLTKNDYVIHIPMSSALSASCETAKNFAKEFNGKVIVIDNKRISVTQKQAVIDAKTMADEGKPVKQIEEFLNQSSANSSIYIMIPTLKYLKKGGRITPAAAAIGSLLQIKPVLQIQGGKLDKYCQVINVNQGKKRMIGQIIQDIKNRFQTQLKNGKLKIFMAYTNCLDKCNKFKEEADKELEPFGLKVSVVNPLSLSVSCHIGDGAIAIACSESYK